jgi:hypothetical protein
LLPTFCLSTFIFFLYLGSGSLWLFDPNIWRPPCSKLENNPDNATEKTQPQHLYPDEGLPQTSYQNQPPFQQPSTQTLPTITEATENPTFNNIPEIQLQQANISTNVASTSQSGGGDHHLNANPPPSQVNPGKAELNQIKIQDWDEAEEDESKAKESELIRVQQEIERLQQEQESIMRRQAATQHAKARR